MRLLKYIAVCLVAWIFVGSVDAGSDSAAIQEEQTKRRRQKEIARLAHEQTLDRSLFERRLSRFDRKVSEAHGTRGSDEQRRLDQNLKTIQQQRERSLSHLEQTLRNLELNDRNDDFRQKQELNRLRHRQQADAFLNRQKVRLRQSRLNARGRR